MLGIIGIDPASVSGFALFEFTGKPFDFGRLLLAQTWKASDLTDQELGLIIVTALNQFNVSKWSAVVERIPRMKHRGPGPLVEEGRWIRTVKAVAKARSVAAGTRYRIPFIQRPNPSTWRGGSNGLGLGGGVLGREVLKQRSADFVRTRFGLELRTSDSADAACLAVWGAHQIGLKRVTDQHWVP